MGNRRREDKRVAQSREHGTKVGGGKHTDNDSHIPAARAARLLDVLVQSPVVVIDNMAMGGAIGVNVGYLVAVCGRLMDMAGITVVIRGLPCDGLGRSNKCCLERKREHSHHHDDGAHTSNKRLRNKSQLCASAPVPKTVPHQLTPGSAYPSISGLGMAIPVTNRP
jgi:hypothetical protein